MFVKYPNFPSCLKELIFTQIRSKLPQFRWLLSAAEYRFIYYHRSQWLDCDGCDEQPLRSP